jgi:hypothetical protein
MKCPTESTTVKITSPHLEVCRISGTFNVEQERGGADHMCFKGEELETRSQNVETSSSNCLCR